MFVKQDKCLLVLSLEKGARLIAYWTIAECLAFLLALLISRQWIGLGLAFLLKLALAAIFIPISLLLSQTTPNRKKAAFSGFVAEMLLQVLVVMALLVGISLNYMQSKNCGKERNDGEWDLTEEDEDESFMASVDECSEYVKLSTTVYTMIYLLATLPIRFWMAWNLRDYTKEGITPVGNET